MNGNVRHLPETLFGNVFLECYMGFLDKLKTAASQATQASSSLASNSAGALWSRYGDKISEVVITYATQAAAKGSPYIADDAKYQASVIDPAWEMLPMPVRLIGRERMKWDAIFYSARSQVFVIDGDAVSVHPEAKQRINDLCAKMLPNDQQKMSEADPPALGCNESSASDHAQSGQRAEPSDAADSR